MLLILKVALKAGVPFNQLEGWPASPTPTVYRHCIDTYSACKLIVEVA